MSAVPSVRDRLVLLALLLVLPLVLGAAGLLAWSYERERAFAVVQLGETADAAALVVDRELGRAEAFLKAFATSRNLAEDRLVPFADRLRDAAEVTEGWFVLFAPSGQELVNTRLAPGEPLPRLSLNDIRGDLAAGKTTVTNLIDGAAVHDKVFAVNVPILRDGRLVYILALAFEPSLLAQVLQEQTLPKGWVAAILDRDNVVVARYPEHRRYIGKHASQSLAALVETNQNGTGLSTTFDDRRVITAWSRSPRFGWTVAVGVPEAQLAISARHAVAIAVVLSALALAAGAAAAARVARSITRPVEALAESAAALGRGEPVTPTATGLRATDAVFEAMATASDALRAREKALRESEEWFRTLVEALPLSAVVFKPDGTPDYCNRSYIAYFGREAVAPQDLAVLPHPDDLARIAEVREPAIAAGRDYNYEARLRRHDGVYRWHLIQLRAVRRGGAIAAWLGASVDIDDMRRMTEELEARVHERTRELEAAQDDLRQAQKLEAVGQLTGGIAHDFNNLLTAVAGNLDLLASEAKSARSQRLIEAAHRAIERGASLTQSLLAFARRQTLRPQTVDPNRLIKEFADLLRRAAGERVELQLLLSPALDACRIDAAQFQAALLNLVVNARDAMPAAGGRISIETENVRIERSALAGDPDTEPGRFVCVKVSDTGAGMSPDIISRAFEPFFTTKDVGKGSGLGLSQVYGFAKQSGGFVRLASELGVGTTVRLYLPRSQARPPDENNAAKAEETGPQPGGTILVVEDDATVRETVAETLRSLGYRVETAADGIAALALIEREQGIDLLFSDVAMPRGIAGDELARRAMRLSPRLKVLLTSGYALAVSAEMPALLRKPYRSDELARAVRTALEG